MCELSGKEVVVLIYAQDTEINYDIGYHDGFLTALGWCFLNTDATQEREDSSDSNKNQESPIPPAVEDITGDYYEEVLPQQLAFTTTHRVVEHKPIEQKNYRKEDEKFKGVKKHKE